MVKRTAQSFIFMVAIALPAHAFAIDLQPGDAVAPPPNLNVVQVTYLASSRGDWYSNGSKVSDQTKLDSNQFQFRYSHTFETADMPSVFYVQTPIGYSHPGGALASLYKPESGVGDTSMLYAIWPYANRETRTYWAVGAYLTVPTGYYDASNGSVNVGANRFATALQTAYQTSVTANIDWMAAVDAVVFGDNPDFSATKKRLGQDPLYTLQTGLSYQINSRYSIAGTYYYTAGAETFQNGVAQNDQTQVQRYQLSLVSNFSFGRILLQYGSDLKTKNGFYEDSRLLLRFVKAF